MTEFNIQSTAFLGAICLDEGLVHYETFDRSVNTPKFIQFIENMHQKIGEQKYAIYLDNLAVHKSKLAKDVYEKLGIETIWAPPYTPELNAIEEYFSMLKHHVKQARLKDMVSKNRRKYKAYIKEAVKKIDVEVVNKFINHNLKLFGIKK